MLTRTYVEVVSRYGGMRHLAIAEHAVGDRHYAQCRGTSAWTIESWEANPDHPTLKPEQMREMPLCQGCVDVSPEYARRTA